MDLTNLGPYKIGRKLGRGGMGTVYAGVESATGQQVAVKLLSPHLAGEEGFRDRFQSEIESLKKLNHPNIVRLYGWGEQDGNLFYSMELIEGTNLEQELRNARRFDWGEVVGIGLDLCKALKHAHDRGVIHRDLKPANLMLAPDGGIKLSDFGIAKLFGTTGMTIDGGVLGTAEYMSPEQADGRGITDRCDLYALGGVLYALLAGRPPFRARSLPEMLQLQRYAAPEPVRRLAPDTPEELELIVSQLLEKEPERRIPSAMIAGRRLEAMIYGLKARAERALRTGDLAAPLELQPDSADGPIDLTGATDSAPPALPSDAPDKTALSISNAGTEAPIGPLTSATEIYHPGISQELTADDPARRLPPPDVTAVTAPANRLQPSQPSSKLSPSSDTYGFEVAKGSAATVSPAGVTRPNEESAAQAAVPAAPPEPPKKTTFVLADEDHSDVDDEPSFVRWAHVGVLLFCLLGVFGTGWYLSRPATADQLYEQIIAAANSDSTSALADAEPSIDAFLTKHAADPRAGEIERVKIEAEQVRAESRSRSLTRRLERQSQRTPLERAYLQAVQPMDVAPGSALAQLRAFLAVYGDDQGTSPLAPACVATAQKLVERLASQVSQANQADRAALAIALTRAAKLAASEPDKARAVWAGIVELYGDQAWAASDVARARSQLENLPRTSPE